MDLLSLPHKRNCPNYSIITFKEGDQQAGANAHYPITPEKLKLFKNYLKLLLVNGATSATPKRSFLTARGLKTGCVRPSHRIELIHQLYEHS